MDKMENLVFVNENDFLKARKKIKEAKNQKKFVVFSSNDDDLSRNVLEKEDIDFFLINQSTRKDKMKQKDSGFNQVLAKIANKKKVSLAINLDELIELDKKRKAEVIGRIIQNVYLANKNKINMVFISTNKNNERSIYDLKSLGSVLRMPTWMVK